MTTRNEARSNTSREANTREEEWTFEEPDALKIPNEVQARFDSDGMALRWLRISVKGSDDVPELAITSFVRDAGRYTGTVCRGDLALAKMPAGKVKARRKYYANKSNVMMDAVNAQLMKSSDSRMPISNTSKSVRTTGRQPSFQD
jgi:hypothetical protein